jgi:T-complex protein 1 subunit alpha
LAHKIKDGDEEILINTARTSMSSKLIGPESALFSKLVVAAVASVKITNPLTGESRYPIKSVNVLKSHGQSSLQSEFIQGYLL